MSNVCFLHDICVFVLWVGRELNLGHISQQLQKETAEHADCIAVITVKSNGSHGMDEKKYNKYNEKDDVGAEKRRKRERSNAVRRDIVRCFSIAHIDVDITKNAK